jgi:hypothetical protein
MPEIDNANKWIECMLMLYAHEDIDKIELDKIARFASSKTIRRKAFWDFLRFTMLMLLFFVCVFVCKVVMAMESVYKCSLGC